MLAEYWSFEDAVIAELVVREQAIEHRQAEIISINRAQRRRVRDMLKTDKPESVDKIETATKETKKKLGRPGHPTLTMLLVAHRISEEQFSAAMDVHEIFERIAGSQRVRLMSFETRIDRGFHSPTGFESPRIMELQQVYSEWREKSRRQSGRARKWRRAILDFCVRELSLNAMERQWNCDRRVFLREFKRSMSLWVRIRKSRSQKLS